MYIVLAWNGISLPRVGLFSFFLFVRWWCRASHPFGSNNNTYIFSFIDKMSSVDGMQDVRAGQNGYGRNNSYIPMTPTMHFWSIKSIFTHAWYLSGVGMERQNE